MSSPHLYDAAARDAALQHTRLRGRGLFDPGAHATPPELLPPLAPRNTCLPLDIAVPSGGYAWWYFDAESDCGRYGMCIIAFVGSVFSPYYYKAQRKNGAQADDHIALNVVLYGKKKAWVFTEAEGFGQSRERYTLQLRKNALRRVDDGYVIDIDERQVPGYAPLRGRVHVRFAASGGLPRALDEAGEHHWWPVAPISRVQVALSTPNLNWSGKAYHDVNWGSGPLPRAFRTWTWLRALHPEGTLVYYAPEGAEGHAARPPFGTLYCHDGSRRDVEVPALQPLKKGRWGLLPVCPGTAEVIEVREDTPFYTRALMRLRCEGLALSAMHEYLDVAAWQKNWVQYLLKFRMRRHRRQSPNHPLLP